MDDISSQTDEGGVSASTEAAPPAPKFLNEKKRFRSIKLEWPLEYDGKVYNSVTVSRMTADEVRKFIEDASQGLRPTLPMFDVPDAVIDALDADDASKVNEAVNDFLPRSLRTETEQSPTSGSTTQA